MSLTVREIVVIKGKRQLKSYLRGCPSKHKAKFKYVFCEQLDKELVSLLEEKGFISCRQFKPDEAYREKFISECIKAVGIAGKEINNRLWWASDIASKNRFTSKLAQACQNFLEIIEAAKDNDYERLLIINPSWVFLFSLKRALAGIGLRIKHRGIFLSKWIEIAWRYLRKILGSFYQAIKVYRRAVYSRKKLQQKLKNLDGVRDYYILKTFIYDSSFKDGVYRDGFFEKLPQFLKTKKNLLIYACILGNYNKGIKNIANCKEYNIVPLEVFLSSGDILKAVKERIFGKLRVNSEINLFEYKINEVLNNELLRTANGVQFYQFLHYWATKKLLNYLKAETMLLTYENNPWEKMCTLAIKEVSPKTKVIWYQNAVIPQAALSMFRSKEDADIAPVPDIILTLGESTKQIMQKYGSYNGLKIEPACGLKFEYLFENSVPERKNQGNILIVLEGIFDSYRLVNYVLRELKNNPAYRLKLRTHPILPLPAFKHKLDYDLAEIGNLTMSSNLSLQQDIEWSDIVIYWGSMAALEALSLGKPLIHFNMGQFLSFDPLFECSDLKWVVDEKDNLAEKIKAISLLSNNEFFRQRSKAKIYLRNYFFPVNEESLHKFVN